MLFLLNIHFSPHKNDHFLIYWSGFWFSQRLLHLIHPPVDLFWSLFPFKMKKIQRIHWTMQKLKNAMRLPHYKWGNTAFREPNQGFFLPDLPTTRHNTPRGNVCKVVAEMLKGSANLKPTLGTNSPNSAAIIRQGGQDRSSSIITQSFNHHHDRYRTAQNTICIFLTSAPSMTPSLTLNAAAAQVSLYGDSMSSALAGKTHKQHHTPHRGSICSSATHR